MEPKIPLVSVGKAEEADPATFAGAIPQLIEADDNFADDEDVQRFVNDFLVSQMRQTVDARAGLEDEWNAIRRMEMLVHDGGRTYVGPSNKYLPLYNKALTTRISTVSTGLFPSDDYMDVSSRSADPEAGIKAKAVKGYIQWEFERNAFVQQMVKIGLNSLENFGNVFYKVWYDKKIVTQLRGTKGSLPSLPGMPGMKRSQYTQCEGMQMSARPLHHVYVYPVTASSLDECELIWETIDVPRWKVEQLGKAKKWKNVELALSTLDDGRHDFNQKQQLDDSAGLAGDDRKANGNACVLAEVWCMMPVPRAALLDDEADGQPVPCKLMLAGNTVLEARRNPHWHQRPPYLMGRTNVQPGLIYGYGIGRIVRDLQYLANDAANQGNDCATYVLIPVNKVNPGAMAGPMLPMKPGRVWFFSDIAKGQMFDRPPTDLIGASQQAINMWVAMLADYSGAPPTLQGTKTAKTATGAQILQRNALNPLQDTVEGLELDVLIPAMWMCWMNGLQFRDKEVMVKVSGVEQPFDPEWLEGDYEHRWLASTQAASQQQRAAQALQLIQLLGGLVPALQAQQKQVDFQYLLTKLATDGFGYRGFEKVIQPMQMPPMGTGGMPGAPPGGPPQPGAAPIEGPQSAIPGQDSGEITPGEGEAFGEVRRSADQVAAEMGASGGFA